jgi:hypothetical protein
VSTPKGPELHMSFSGQKDPVLLLNVSIQQRSFLHLDVSAEMKILGGVISAKNIKNNVTNLYFLFHFYLILSSSIGFLVYPTKIKLKSFNVFNLFSTLM